MDCVECEKYCGNFELDNKKYCSKCYTNKTGKFFTNFKYDSESDIINVLKEVYSYSKITVTHIKLQIKNSKNLAMDLPYITSNLYKNTIFFMSEDAKVINNIIKENSSINDFINHYNHIFCSRILDYWNINKKDHDIAECYYNGPMPRIINESILYINSNIKSKFMYNIKRSKIRTNIFYDIGE